VHGLHRTYHRLGNYFGRTQWPFYVTWVKWKLVSIHLETVLILTQDMYRVCTECAIGSEIILGTPDGTPRCRGFSGSSFLIWLVIVLMSTQDRCMVCSKHNIGYEIILDAPDTTPT
jgi:hypothetical protein